MKFCQKYNCDLLAIPRGKYCELHRTNKPKRDDTTQLSIPKIDDIESKLKIEEDRFLREEQDLQFKETERQDRERLEQLEFEKILEMSRQNYFEELKESLKDEININSDDCFTIKFQFPNGLKNIKKFRHDVVVKTIRNYLDVYIHENNMNIKKYNLVLNFPKIELNEEFDTYQIKEFTTSSNFVLHVQDLEK